MRLSRVVVVVNDAVCDCFDVEGVSCVGWDPLAVPLASLLGPEPSNTCLNLGLSVFRRRVPMVSTWIGRIIVCV